MKITRNASAPSRIGETPANFTGYVRVDNAAAAEPPSRVTTASVTFAPGARTTWHTHPAGQTIIIIAGRGWVRRADGPVEDVNPGDTVLFAANEKQLAWRHRYDRHEPYRRNGNLWMA